MMRAKRLLAATLLIALAATRPALAATAPTPDPIELQKYGDAQKAKLYKYDTAVPAAPALALVQKAPELSVTSPFGPDIQKDIAFTGEHVGAAFAFRPYWVLGEGAGISLKAYRNDRGIADRIWARTTISAAAAPNDTKQNKGFGAALGLHTELLDAGDPHMKDAHIYCLGDLATVISQDDAAVDLKLNTDAAAVASARLQAARLLPSLSDDERDQLAGAGSVFAVGQVVHRKDPTKDDAFKAWRNEQLIAARPDNLAARHEKATTACFAQAAVAMENSLSFQVGVGSVAQSPDYGFSKLKYAGTSVWAAFRIPLGAYAACNFKGAAAATVVFKDGDGVDQSRLCVSPLGNLTAFAHLVSDDKVKVGTKDEGARTAQGGLVVSHHAKDNTWSLAGSAVWISQDFKTAGLKNDDYARYGISYSHKLFEGTWLEASFGETSGRRAKEDSYGLVRVTFK